MIVVADTKCALYFGCKGQPGHFVHERGLRSEASSLPWNDPLMDTGLLKNMRMPDEPDGRVHWTCGGTPLWIAFVWWDRSGDARPNSNSGFYVKGFHHDDRRAAFEFACEQWPDVVARQHHPLVLVDDPRPSLDMP